MTETPSAAEEAADTGERVGGFGQERPVELEALRGYRVDLQRPPSSFSRSSTENTSPAPDVSPANTTSRGSVPRSTTHRYAASTSSTAAGNGHYTEERRAALVLWIATTNLFNRVNATIREPVGANWG